MLDAFRLMLVFTLLDPIKVTVAHLFLAVGEPEQVVRARGVQLVVLVVGLYSLGSFLGIAGVALAVDVMMVVGLVILLHQARKHVDLSLRTLLGVPSMALLLGILITVAILSLPLSQGSDWRTGLIKVVAFSLVYGVILWVFERRQLTEMLDLMRGILRPRQSMGSARARE